MAQLWFQLNSLVSICQDVRGYTMLPLPGPSYSCTPPPPQGTVFLRPGAKINLSFSKIFFFFLADILLMAMREVTNLVGVGQNKATFNICE